MHSDYTVLFVLRMHTLIPYPQHIRSTVPVGPGGPMTLVLGHQYIQYSCRCGVYIPRRRKTIIIIREVSFTFHTLCKGIRLMHASM